MKILLDTSTFLWTLWDKEKLSNTARDVIINKNNICYFSHVSVWEITIKYQLDKLPLPAPPEQWLEHSCKAHDILLFPIDLRSIYKLCELPHIHKDPFDRLLIAQAVTNDMILLTSDGLITQYNNVQTMW